MPSASSLSPENRFVALFVGESGSGKTVAECSFPGPIDVDDFDGRIRGILGAPWIDKTKIQYDFYPPKSVLGQKPNYVKINEKMETLMIMAQSGQMKIQTKVIDSLTSSTFAMLMDALPFTHNSQSGKGKSLGQLAMPGPEDYGFEAVNTYNLLAFLRSLSIPNIIVSAHMVDRFGKIDPDNAFSESVVVGKKLSIRDKIATNSMIYFDHIFEFYRYDSKFTVKFRGDLARTSYAELPNGEHDITGKNFYEFMMGFLKKDKNAN